MKTLLLCFAVLSDADNPTSLQQYQSDGSTVIAQAGTAGTGTVVLKGIVNNTTGVPIKLQVEVVLNGASFAGAVTAQDAAWTTNGNLSTVTVAGLTPGAQYKWQARTYSN